MKVVNLDATKAVKRDASTVVTKVDERDAWKADW